MKKVKRILAGLLGFAIIFGLLAFYDSQNGDPFSEAHAKRRAVAYAQKLYPGQTFTVEQILYDSPFAYRAVVQSQQSRDTCFDIVTRHWTDTSDRLSGDETPMHEWFVESGRNTCNRMGREAAKQAAFVLQRELPNLELLPVFGIDSDKTEIDLCYPGDNEELAKYREYLPLDEDFHPSILQHVPARLAAQVLWPGIPTEEDLRTTLKEIKSAMEAYEMPMTCYDVTLVPEGYAENDGLRESILESGLIASEDIQ